MEPASGSAPSTTVLSTIVPATITSTATIAAAAKAAAGSCSGSIVKTNNSTTLMLASGSISSGSAAAATVLPPNLTLKQQQQQQQPLQLDTKVEEANNLSLTSLMSEGQRSHSGAPSASSSPILSPPGKIFGRNANGTMIATSRPSNEAEVQLYRVLQRASLLAYYDTLLEMGGDDVQQLYEAGEEEFLEIMALVGMASKPLHVRRLQKVLHEWANNPSFFQGPMLSGVTGFCETPTKVPTIFTAEPSALSRAKFPSIAHAFNPTPLVSTASTTIISTLPSILPTPTTLLPSVILPHTSLSLSTSSTSLGATPTQQQHSGVTSHQVTSSSPQLTPVLTEMQVARITLGAEKIARQLPQREPRAQTSKKRTSRELEQVIAMSEHDPRRMDEIRKYSAIYGRFDCKRRPEKPLTLHEVCVNEAAAQLCRLVPALLTRRDELFPLARQIVKDAGFGHSASIARYGGLVPQMQAQHTQRSSVVIVDCESSDASVTPKRPRLSSTETSTTPEMNREHMDDSRYNLFAMYQKFAKPPFDLSEIAKFSLGKSDFDDNDSRFSFSNSSSPSMQHNNGSEHEREFSDGAVAYAADSAMKSPNQTHCLQLNLQSGSSHAAQTQVECCAMDTHTMTSSPLGGVQVLSAAGGQIIAVANPALALSPTLNDALSIKREIGSPEA